MKIGADKRSREVDPASAARRAAREAFAVLAGAEAKAAKALATIERSRAYLYAGIRSVYQWAARVGYGPQQTRRLLDLGRTLLDVPELDEKVAQGAVTGETAAQVGRVLREPALDLTPRQRAAWIHKAEHEDPRAVRAQAEKAIEDARQGAPTLPMRFRVTRKTRDAFERVRLLLAQGRRRLPSNGAVLGIALQDWLLRHDPLHKPLPNRRSFRRTRTVPARVRALVQRRSRGQCEICKDRRAMEYAHLTPFAKGGGNEADDLAHACLDCHVLLDAGVFRFSRFDEAGRPVFLFDHDRFGSMADRGAAFGASGSSGASGASRASRASGVRERKPPAYRASRRRRRAAPATGPP